MLPPAFKVKAAPVALELNCKLRCALKVRFFASITLSDDIFKSCVAPMWAAPLARVCTSNFTESELVTSMYTSPAVEWATILSALTFSSDVDDPMPAVAEISRTPKSMLTVTPLDAGMVRLVARNVRASKLRFKLVNPGASLNTRLVPVTDKLPFSLEVCAAFNSSDVTPDQLIASFFPANKPDKKLTDVSAELICSLPAWPFASASNRMPFMN